MTNLPTYSSNKNCPKCSTTGASTTHYEEDEDRKFIIRNVPYLMTRREKREHMRRVCPRCSYEWNEAPINTIPVVEINISEDLERLIDIEASRQEISHQQIVEEAMHCYLDHLDTMDKPKHDISKSEFDDVITTINQQISSNNSIYNAVRIGLNVIGLSVAPQTK